MTIPKEEIESNIKEMGYIVATPQTTAPSYYKLKDGTILRALIHVNYVTPSPGQTSTVASVEVNSTNIIAVYVPKHKRRPEAFQPFDPSELQHAVVDDDMEPEPLREDFSVYDMSDGTILSVKTVAGQIHKTKFYTQNGEPVYQVNITPIVKTTKKMKKTD